MPGFDGTGPGGQGPFTGGGRGFCVLPVGQGLNVSSGISGRWNYPTNASYPYQPAYGMPSNLMYGSYGYLGRSAGFTRGRRPGGAVFRGTGIRGRGRRF